MTKHGRNKKARSSSRNSKALKSSFANAKFKNPNALFQNDTIKAKWNPLISPLQNMSQMGLRTGVNDDITVSLCEQGRGAERTKGERRKSDERATRSRASEQTPPVTRRVSPKAACFALLRALALLPLLPCCHCGPTILLVPALVLFQPSPPPSPPLLLTPITPSNPVARTARTLRTQPAPRSSSSISPQTVPRSPSTPRPTSSCPCLWTTRRE